MTLKSIVAFVVLLTVLGSAVSYALANNTQKVYLPLVSCPTCTGPTTAPGNPTPNPTPNPASYTTRMIQLVNQARTAAGCPAVTAHTSLMKGAQDWTNHMAATGDYRHSGAGYYAGYGYPSNILVENVGVGGSAEDAFEGWMQSTNHKNNILFCLPPTDPSYSPTLVYEIGVGHNDGYWTLVIAERQP